MSSLSYSGYSLDDSIGLGDLQLTSKAVQEEISTDDDGAHPKACKRLSITDLPDDFLILVYKSLKSNTDYSSFSLVCRHWLHIQNNNHESLWDIYYYKCSLRESPKISPESFSKILCKLLIRFQHLKRLSLKDLPEVTDYLTSQSQLFISKVQFLRLKGRYEYSDKQLSLIFSLFPRLASVRLSNQGLGSLITNKGLEVIAKCCPSLQKVDLENCQKITDDGLEFLATSCVSLKKVNLTDCEQITDKGLEILGKSCSSLEKVYLGNCKRITDKGLQVLAKCCASLQKVNLEGCQKITDKGLEVLAKCCASLQKVDLGYCQNITDEGLEVLAKCCSSLEIVDLENCQQITDKGIEILAKSCASLENVDLAKCQGITDSGISFLIQNCSKIRSVRISYCNNVTGIGFLGCSKTLSHVSADDMVKLTTGGIKEIASGGGMEFLSLSGNAVKNEVVVSISKGCPLLKILKLESCPEVQLEGWKAIGLYCKNLEILHVEKCPNLCDEGLKALCYGCNKLSWLYLDNWSEIGLELFKRERPDVEFLC